MKQLKILKNQKSSYGGELLKTRKGRAHSRPLAVRSTMHLVLRSTKAKGEWSFRRGKNPNHVKRIVKKFADKYGVQIYALANVGNHIHFHIKLSNRHTYAPFIRAVTAAISIAVTGASRIRPLKKSAKDRFWDCRPFSRIVESFKGFLKMRDYVRINQLEGDGYPRDVARIILMEERSQAARLDSSPDCSS